MVDYRLIIRGSTWRTIPPIGHFLIEATAGKHKTALVCNIRLTVSHKASSPVMTTDVDGVERNILLFARTRQDGGCCFNKYNVYLSKETIHKEQQ